MRRSTDDPNKKRCKPALDRELDALAFASAAIFLLAASINCSLERFFAALSIVRVSCLRFLLISAETWERSWLSALRRSSKRCRNDASCSRTLARAAARLSLDVPLRTRHYQEKNNITSIDTCIASTCTTLAMAAHYHAESIHEPAITPAFGDTRRKRQKTKNNRNITAATEDMISTGKFWPFTSAPRIALRAEIPSRMTI